MITVLGLKAAAAVRRIASRAPAALLTGWRGSYGALSSLDDRTLQDIGFDRTMTLSASTQGMRFVPDARPTPRPNN